VWDPQRQRLSGQVKVFAENWKDKAKQTKKEMAGDLSWLGGTLSTDGKTLKPLFEKEWEERMGETPDVYQITKDLEKGDEETLKLQEEVMIGPRYEDPEFADDDAGLHEDPEEEE
jgi:hypothetical protein